MSSSKPRSSDADRLLASAIRYAGTGVRSSRQVLAALRRAGASAREAQRLVAACRVRGLVDDRACARLRAEHLARRGYAWAAIRATLSAQGLTDGDIASAGHALGTAAEDAARARDVAASYHRRIPRPTAQRLARRLASRGFDADLIERVVAESCGVSASHAEC